MFYDIFLGEYLVTFMFLSLQVVVIFQPHDQGSFSQIWDIQVKKVAQTFEYGMVITTYFLLQVSTGDIDDKRLRLSFGGKVL